MIKRSEKAVKASTEAEKAKFVVNGQIDYTAVREEAEKRAKSLFKTGNVIYKTESDMASGFEKEILANIK